ncbi:hypothetical protein [Mycolicibacterium sp. J2]|uniref:hypothetical protein n=1 Tax=Mycolicibacterium sp. J2 TaxID=2993511 RepID=UPI00224ACD62|nr:hypothetical protein [Mycolicibacterium sp. J2]MCX2715725.1 hypothetical protein [Mycolicibacterium sp. J2]
MSFIQYYLDCLPHASYLIGERRYGATDVSDVLGGFGAWQETCAAAESAAQ